ncbi:MAG: transferase hexapeptide repeat family protein [Proteobacteria bacterium]|nr:transferase hexapeptide repeat family protein [Pseudomonadota bacterium]MCH9757743.1 transferase hexapeptide repeat family protein [Pseudomonadota bacterium]
MPCYTFENITPVIHPTAFVHPSAVLIGDVWIGKNCYIAPLASLRGDFGRIRVMDGANVQDCCVLHGFPEHEIRLEENAHIGHGAVIHTAIVRKDALVGINAVVLDYAEVGEQAIVAANSTVPNSYKVPPRVLFAGSPGQVKRELSAENIAAKKAGTLTYQQLAKRSIIGVRETTPLCTDDLQRPTTDWQLPFDASFNLRKP